MNQAAKANDNGRGSQGGVLTPKRAAKESAMNKLVLLAGILCCLHSA